MGPPPLGAISAKAVHDTAATVHAGSRQERGWAVKPPVVLRLIVQAAPEPSTDSAAIPGKEGTPVQPEAATPDLVHLVRNTTEGRRSEEAPDNLLGLAALEELPVGPLSALASPAEAATPMETAVGVKDDDSGDMQRLLVAGNTQALPDMSISGGQAMLPSEREETRVSEQVTVAALVADCPKVAAPTAGEPIALIAEDRDKTVDKVGSAADGGGADAQPEPQPAADAFAVLCCEVFEPRSGRANVDRPEVARITENPLFLLALGRVTDDAPSPTATAADTPVHAPPDVATSAAAVEEHQGAELGDPMPAEHGDEHTCMVDAIEAATESESMQPAALAEVSREAEAAEEEHAAAEEEADSDHEKTLRGRQACSVARKIRESWGALQQEQPTIISAQQKQTTEPAQRQGQISSVHGGQPWSLPSIKDALALRRTSYTDEGEAEDITDVIYANWGSVADTPGHLGESHATTMCTAFMSLPWMMRSQHRVRMIVVVSCATVDYRCDAPK